MSTSTLASKWTLLIICIVSSHRQCLAAGVEGCRYRDYPVPMPFKVFALWGCWGCYNYMQRYAAEGQIPVNFKCRLDGYKIPCHNETLYFNRSDVDMVNQISASLRDEKDVGKWLQCCEASENCCHSHLGLSKTVGESNSAGWKNETKCPALWDGWECWGETTPGTTARGSCPSYIYSGEPPSCQLSSRKTCFSNGTWTVHTDFASCSASSQLRSRHTFHIAILGISTGAALPALAIFFLLKRIKNTRVRLHRALLTAIVARNVLVILNKSLVILDDINSTDVEMSALVENSVWCRVLKALEKLATNAVFCCMTLESVYLHQLLARALRGQPNMMPFYVTAATLSGVFTGTWVAAMATMNNQYCWTVDANDLNLHWINDSLRIALLVVNTILLVDVIRVLVSKLSKIQNATTSRIRRTVKATTLLAPVFGVQFLFTAVRPATVDCVAMQVYYYFSYSMEGLQAILVALLYCYLNKEVQLALRVSLERRFGLVLRKPRLSLITDLTELANSKKLSVDVKLNYK